MSSEAHADSSNESNPKQKTKSTILFILPWSLTEVGGVNQVVINLAKQFEHKLNITPIVLVTDWNAIEPTWETINDVKTVRWRIREFNKNASIKEKLVYWLWEIKFRKEFNKFCATHRVHALNVHYVGPIAFTLNRLRKNAERITPLHLSFHGSDLKTLSELPKSELEPWCVLFRDIDSIIVCSRSLERRFRDVFSQTIETSVIYNGIDSNAFCIMNNNQSRPINTRYILTVGKFERQKGQDVLIEAFSQIATECQDVDLILVGATSTELANLKEMRDKKGLKSRVWFYQDKPHEEMANFFCHAELFVLPSRIEAFPIVLLEAGALGLPVIATSVGGIPELITDGKTGRLVKPDDPIMLASMLRTALVYPSETKILGESLRRYIAENFTWRIAAEKYYSLIYKKLM